MLARAEAQRVYGAERESYNEAPGILWSTPPFHISGGRHWKARSRCEIYSCSQGARRWFSGGCCWESRTPGLSVWQQAVSWAVFVTPLSCFPQSRCNSLTFRTSILLHLLLDLDTYGGVDPLGVFPLFLKKVADIIAPNLRIIFCRLIGLGSFPECMLSC